MHLAPKAPLIVLTLFLGGCSVLTNSVAVQTLGPTANPDKYAADQAYCAKYAPGYKSPLSIGSVLASGAEGGAQNAPGAAASPLVPVLGAAGSATSQVIANVDPFGVTQAKVYFNCVVDLTNRDLSAVVARPN